MTEEADAVSRLNQEAQIDQLRAELEEARSSASTYLDLAQRSQADFANYKRRVERDREGEQQVARAATVAEVLPVLDDLDRAIAHTPAELGDHPWAQGVRMIASRMTAALGRLGIERVGAIGDEFDPSLHEAVATAAGRDVAPGHVAEIIRPGYRSGERLLRPAQVVVAAGASPEPADQDGSSAEDPRSTTRRGARDHAGSPRATAGPAGGVVDERV